MTKKERFFACFFLTLSLFCVIPTKTPAQKANTLETGQWLFQHEKYEEALAVFSELRAQNPQSSEAAYYLGMTYKRMQDFILAKPHLEAAVTLQPNVKNAYLELIDLLYQLDQFDEAKKYIAAAEKEVTDPSQTAFFKGLVILKEGKDPEEAIKLFDQAQMLNPSLANSVKYQKAMAYVQLKKFKEARGIFRDITLKDSSSGLARFANEYVDMIDRKEDSLRPFHGTIGYSIQYDDNVVFLPNNDKLATDVSQDSDWKHVFTSQGDYKIKFKDNFSLRTGYSFYGTKHNSLGFYDMMSYDLPVQPVFYFEKASVAFPMHYTYVSVNDRKYLETMGFSNLDNLVLEKNQMLQLQFQYTIDRYQWAVTDPADSKKGREYLWSPGWFYFFGKNQEGYFNLRYALNYNDAEGENWRYRGNRFTLSSLVPVIDKLRWSFVADYFRQDYLKKNLTYDKSRHDDICTILNLFAYEICKNTELQLQHTFTYDGASIGIYKYKKNVYGAGVKCRF